MIRLKLKGGDSTVKLLDRLPQKVRIALLRAVREAGILVQSLAREKAPVGNTGLLRLKIDFRLKEEGLDRVVGEVGSELPYAKVLESGTTTRWTPPISRLRQWARRKLGDEKWGYIAYYKIQRRGFPRRPDQAYLAPAIQEAHSRMEMIFKERLTEALQQEGGTA